MLNQSASLDRVFHALADPTRRDILQRLTRGPTSVSALAEPLNMSLPAVVQHLKVLEASRLVRTEKRGRVRTCRVDARTLAAAEQWLSRHRLAWERRLDRLGEILGEDSDLNS